MVKHAHRQLRLMIAASLTGAFVTGMLSPERRAKRRWKDAAAPGKSAMVTAQSIARQLLDQRLGQDELFDAMWTWHYDTAIEPSAIYERYKQLREHQLKD